MTREFSHLWSRTGIQRYALVLLILLTGCTRRGSELDGEWLIELTATSPLGGTAGERRTVGVVVIDPSIREWEGIKAVDVPRPYVIGRKYVDLGPLWGRPHRSPTSVVFGPSEHADFAEEVIASVDQGTVRMVFSPRVTGSNVIFDGELVGDSIVGTFTQRAHPDHTLQGSFRMVRREPTEVSDSARIRSGRKR